MDDNCLLMIIIAFVVGYMCSGMMNNICGSRLVEGKMTKSGSDEIFDNSIADFIDSITIL